MSTLAYKPNVDETIRRLGLWHGRQALDRVFAAFDVPSAALAEFQKQYSEGFCDYPDPFHRARFWDKLLAERAAVDDDSMPIAYLSEMDQGLYGGVIGGEVQFMAHPENGWISSMVAPLLDDWSDFDALEFDESHPWFQRYLAQLRTFVKAAEGKFGVSHFILIDGLNFVFELVGATRTYLSLIEQPEMVRRAVEFALELNLRIQQTFFDIAPLFEGGTSSNMVQWIPGRIVSESVDPFHMTSLDYFEDWGREPIERLLGRFDGGVFHIHGNGRHLLETVCSITGAKAIFMGDDIGFPTAFEIRDELRARAGHMPLVIQVEFDKFIDNLNRHTLAGGVLYKVSGTPDCDSANRCMERVREYRV